MIDTMTSQNIDLSSWDTCILIFYLAENTLYLHCTYVHVVRFVITEATGVKCYVQIYTDGRK